MITQEQLEAARALLAKGASLAFAAGAIDVDAGELDIALWNGLGKKAGRDTQRQRLRSKRRSRRLAPRPWTGTAQVKLRMYWDDNVPARVIARVLARTEGAIYERARILGLKRRRSRDSGRDNRSEVAAA